MLGTIHQNWNRVSGRNSLHRLSPWSSHAPRSVPRALRSSFSLAELMVAIGILGIGMLMVAASFPVAINQTRQAVELQSSQMVCNEATNTLKTKIKWTELEEYMDTDTDGTGPDIAKGAQQSRYLLGTKVWLLSFNTVNRETIPPNNEDYFPNLTNTDCIYSADNTYGWLTACQKLTDGMYKFWIFVVREPSGIENSGATDLKVRLNPPITITTAGRRITFASGATTPNKRQFMLGEDGIIYKVTETSPAGSSVMCDKDATGLNGKDITYITGTSLTRKAPTVAVYQTVINY